MRNISDKIYTEYQNTHFTFSTLFPKIVPFRRQCGGINMVQPETLHMTI